MKTLHDDIETKCDSTVEAARPILTDMSQGAQMFVLAAIEAAFRLGAATALRSVQHHLDDGRLQSAATSIVCFNEAENLYADAHRVVDKHFGEECNDKRSKR